MHNRELNRMSLFDIELTLTDRKNKINEIIKNLEIMELNDINKLLYDTNKTVENIKRSIKNIGEKKKEIADCGGIMLIEKGTKTSWSQLYDFEKD